MKFEDNLGVKVDMSKVKVDVIKPWITKRVYELLKVEDDVVVEFIFNQLEDEKVSFLAIQYLVNSSQVKLLNVVSLSSKLWVQVTYMRSNHLSLHCDA